MPLTKKYAMNRESSHAFSILMDCPEAPLVRIFSHCLSPLGVHIERVTTYKSFMRRLGRNRYDLLLTRHSEPLLESRVWVEVLRQTGHEGKLWLIADRLTAEESVALLERGVAQLFTLPVSTTRLVRRVKSKITSKRETRERECCAERRMCHPLTVTIHRFLTDEECEGGASLLFYAPRGGERRALARVVATLVRCVAECRPERVRLLSRAWDLEMMLSRRILHTRGSVRSEAFELLLLLYPSKECVEPIARHHFTTPSHALAQLLLVIATSPICVEQLLARHPYGLSWEEVGLVVGTLKRVAHTLTPPTEESATACGNVALYMLYLASEEGVGKVGELAPLFASSPEARLRTRALGALFREAMFSPRRENSVGS